MKAFFKWMSGLSIVALALTVIACVVLYQLMQADPGLVVHIDDASYTADTMGPLEWLITAGVTLLVGVIVAVVVPTAMILGLGLPLLILGGVGLLMASPVLAIGALVWWLARRGARPATRPTSPATTA